MQLSVVAYVLISVQLTVSLPQTWFKNPYGNAIGFRSLGEERGGDNSTDSRTNKSIAYVDDASKQTTIIVVLSTSTRLDLRNETQFPVLSEACFENYAPDSNCGPIFIPSEKNLGLVITVKNLNIRVKPEYSGYSFNSDYFANTRSNVNSRSSYKCRDYLKITESIVNSPVKALQLAKRPYKLCGQLDRRGKTYVGEREYKTTPGANVTIQLFRDADRIRDISLGTAWTKSTGSNLFSEVLGGELVISVYSESASTTTTTTEDPLVNWRFNYQDTDWMRRNFEIPTFPTYKPITYRPSYSYETTSTSSSSTRGFWFIFLVIVLILKAIFIGCRVMNRDSESIPTASSQRGIVHNQSQNRGARTHRANSDLDAFVVPSQLLIGFSEDQPRPTNAFTNITVIASGDNSRPPSPPPMYPGPPKPTEDSAAPPPAYESLFQKPEQNNNQNS